MANYKSLWTKTAELAVTIYALGGDEKALGPVRREMARAAGEAIGKLDREETAVYRACYMDLMDTRKASEQMGISLRTFYRVRDRLLEKVARELRR